VPYKRSWDQKAYARAYYLDNKAAFIERARTRNREQERLVTGAIRAAKEAPCADCGVRYPYYVMQFDHVRGEKLFDIGAWKTQSARSLRAVRAEMAKCDVVCANCHAERTYQRGYGTAPEANPDQATLW
jgi:hypothetical protein